jgi:hypothetical protein
MFSTCCINGQTDATQTPISSQIEWTINTGSSSYNNWLLKELSTRDDINFLFDNIILIKLRIQEILVVTLHISIQKVKVFLIK